MAGNADFVFPFQHGCHNRFSQIEKIDMTRQDCNHQHQYDIRREFRKRKRIMLPNLLKVHVLQFIFCICHYFFVVIIIIVVICDFFTTSFNCFFFVFFLLKSEWQQVSSSVQELFSVYGYLNNVVVRMISSSPLISKSSSPFIISLGIVPSAPITISITVTFMFHSFLVLWLSQRTYLSFSFL